MRNILVFFTDSHRRGTLCLNGNPLSLTRHFDRLALSGTFFREGLVLTRGQENR